MKTQHTIRQNLWDAGKAVLREKLTAVNFSIKKKGSQINNPNFCLRHWKRKMKHKASRREVYQCPEVTKYHTLSIRNLISHSS